MFEILIDTNIYRKDPAQLSLPFKALERLCVGNLAKLHIPYIVLREFQTQQIYSCEKEMQSAISSISSVLKKPLSGNVKENISKLLESIKTSTPMVVNDAPLSIEVWAKKIGALIHPLNLGDAERAMEAYFKGNLPLKEAKVRKDIPDAFLFQSALTILSSTKKLYVISEDGPFSDAANSTDSIILFKSLNEFIELAEVQAALKKQVEVEKIVSIIESIKENSTSELYNTVENSLGDMLVWTKIHSREIPDDNNEATISSYGETRDFEIDFSEAAYYGGGQIGLPFSCILNVSAIYYIFKADYYSGDYHSSRVSDHNEHYFETEGNFDLFVNGSLSVNVKIEDYDEKKDIDDYVDLEGAKIDGILSVKLHEDD